MERPTTAPFFTLSIMANQNTQSSQSSWLDWIPFVSLGSGLFGAIADIFEGDANRDFQREALQRQMVFNRTERELSQAYNTDEREASQQFNKEMWELNNEYNSPVNAMQRLKDAGINPTAAAMGMTGGNASSPVSSSVPMSSTPASASLMQNGSYDIGAIISRIGENIANVRKTNAEAIGLEKENNRSDERWELDKQERLQAIASSKTDQAYKDAIRGKTEQEVAWMDRLNTLLIDEGYARIEQIEAAVLQAEEQINLTKEQEHSEQAKRELMKHQGAAEDAAAVASLASARQSDASAGLIGEQTETEAARRENVRMENTKQWEEVKGIRIDNQRKAFEQSFRDQGIDPSGGAAKMVVSALVSHSRNKGQLARAAFTIAKRAISDTAKKHGGKYQKKYASKE